MRTNLYIICTINGVTERCAKGLLGKMFNSRKKSYCFCCDTIVTHCTKISFNVEQGQNNLHLGLVFSGHLFDPKIVTIDCESTECIFC